MSKKIVKENHICKYCGDDISHLRSNAVICKKQECINAYSRDKYKTNLKEKTCKFCGKTFMGRAKQLCCDDCKRKRKPNLKKIEQVIYCKHCGSEIRTEIKNVTKTSSKLHNEVCEVCKSKNFKLQSERMKLNNPSYKKSLTTEEYEEIQQKKKEKEDLWNSTKDFKIAENKQKASIRMRNFNPMRNEQSKSKMIATLKDRVNSGEIVYKRGKEHHLYKGNRSFNLEVRSALGTWIKSKLENANYTCEECGKTNITLNVHHLKPLREIIKEYLNKYNVTCETLEKGSQLWVTIIDDIKKYHENNDDISYVVCEKCHSKIDKYFKLRKNENR